MAFVRRIFNNPVSVTVTAMRASATPFIPSLDSPKSKPKPVLSSAQYSPSDSASTSSTFDDEPADPIYSGGSTSLLYQFGLLSPSTRINKQDFAIGRLSNSDYNLMATAPAEGPVDTPRQKNLTVVPLQINSNTETHELAERVPHCLATTPLLHGGDSLLSEVDMQDSTIAKSLLQISPDMDEVLDVSKPQKVKSPYCAQGLRKSVLPKGEPVKKKPPSWEC